MEICYFHAYESSIWYFRVSKLSYLLINFIFILFWMSITSAYLQTLELFLCNLLYCWMFLRSFLFDLLYFQFPPFPFGFSSIFIEFLFHILYLLPYFIWLFFWMHACLSVFFWDLSKIDFQNLICLDLFLLLIFYFFGWHLIHSHWRPLQWN